MIPECSHIAHTFDTSLLLVDHQTNSVKKLMSPDGSESPEKANNSHHKINI